AQRWDHWHISTEALIGLPRVHLWPADANVSPFFIPIGVPREHVDAVTQKILSRGVEVRSLMGGAIHLHPAFQRLAHDGLTNCAALGATTFFVGIHQTLNTDKVRRAAAIVREVLKRI